MIAWLQQFWTASIRRQLMLGIVLVHAALMSFFVVDLVSRQRDFLHAHNLESTLGLAHTLAVNSSSWVLANDVMGLEEVLHSLRAYPDLQYALVVDSRDLRVLGHSQAGLTGQYLADSTSQALLDGNPKPHILHDSVHLIDVAVPILLDELLVGWARIGISQTHYHLSLQQVARNGLLYTLFAILIGLGFAYALSRGLTHSLYELLWLTQNIRSGQRQLRATTQRHDELGRLAREFNLMLDTLESREQELRLTRERLTLALQGSNDGLWDWDINQQVVFYSSRWKSMLCYADTDIAADYAAWQNLIHPDDAPRVTDSLQAHLRGQTACYEVVCRLRCKNGSYAWIMARGLVRRDAQGHPLRMVGTHTDVTQLKDTETKLSDANLRLAKLLDSMHDAVLVEDEHHQVLLVNQNFCHYFGVPRPEQMLLGHNAETAFGAMQSTVEDVSGFMARCQQLSLQRQPVFGELLKLYDGRVLEYDYMPIVVDGEFRGQMWQYDDVTARRQMDIDLHAQKERLQVTLDAIAEGVITTDLQQRVDYLNPVAEYLTGWRAADAYGRPLSEIFNSYDDTDEPALLVPLTFSQTKTSGANRNLILINRRGERCAIEQCSAPIRDYNGDSSGAVIVFRDVSHARDMAQKIRWQASHDALTGLANRRVFEERLRQLLENAHDTGSSHALLYLDLDQFKVINDTCGHRAGDELLYRLASLLESQMQTDDLLARPGGDEFGILLSDCTLDTAKQRAALLRDSISNFRFDWLEHTYTLGVSIGLAALDQQAGNSADALSAADLACYAAKEQGRNRIHVHQPDDRDILKRQGEMHWVSRIRNALEEQRLVLYCQTIAPLRGPETSNLHFEVLLRMRDEQGLIVLPNAFLPAAERYNLMQQLDNWVVEATFSTLHRCQQQADEPCASVTCSINLSGASLTDDDMLKHIKQLFQQYQISPQNICFEITETVAVSNLAKASYFIKTLRKMGCRFSLDDFGTGLSSFAYLKELPVDYLKIDGSFVRDILHDPSDRAIVSAINQIAHTLGLQTIAEFVETDTIRSMLIDLEVDYAQGYCMHKPAPLEETLLSLAHLSTTCDLST